MHIGIRDEALNRISLVAVLSAERGGARAALASLCCDRTCRDTFGGRVTGGFMIQSLFTDEGT